MSKSRKGNFLISICNFFSRLFRMQVKKNQEIAKNAFEEDKPKSSEFNVVLSKQTIHYLEELGIIQPKVKYENATDYIKARIKKEIDKNNNDYQDIDLESPTLILNLMGDSSNSHRFPKDLVEKAISENVSHKVIEELTTFSGGGSKPIGRRSNNVTFSKRNPPEKVQELLRKRREENLKKKPWDRRPIMRCI